jgi:hypothetical protein
MVRGLERREDTDAIGNVRKEGFRKYREWK